MAVITSEHVARKRRRCSVCDGWIETGQRYESAVATPDDPEIGNTKWWRIATHLKNCHGSRGENK